LQKVFYNEFRYNYGGIIFVKLLVSNLIWHFVANLRISQFDLTHFIIIRVHLPVWKRMLLDVKLGWFKDFT